MGSIMRYGGPITYLIIYSFILLANLVWVDSGTRLPRRLGSSRNTSLHADSTKLSRKDVIAEAMAATNSEDLLRVLRVTKSYQADKVVDDVSLGVSRDTLFALLGPNGAGKTTTFNMIRKLRPFLFLVFFFSNFRTFVGGEVIPEFGEVIINGTSVIRHPRTARLSLGVCPQFTAIDSQLTVREHLIIYGRLKGLKKGSELEENVELVLQGTALSMYADRLASKLSGGNQRKLSLAIALIGSSRRDRRLQSC